jgi:hypothetical protein
MRDSINVTQQLNIMPDHAGLQFATCNDENQNQNVLNEIHN